MAMNFSRVAANCLKLGRIAAVQNESKMIKAGLSTSIVRQSSRGEVHPGYKKIRAKMERFQIDDGIPVHLKGGASDIVLYYITMVLCVVGVIGSADYIYHSSFPKKDKEC